MAPFDRSYSTYYWSAIVNISATIFELFDVEWYHDLEIWVRGHSRWFKLVPFANLGAVSYWSSIVTMALSCIMCEIERNIDRKSWFFIPLAFDAPVMGSPSEYCHLVWCEKTRMVGPPNGDKILRISRHNTGVWRKTDRQTSCHGIVCDMHMRHAVKIVIILRCNPWAVGWWPEGTL